jgi:hypothetical protein
MESQRNNEVLSVSPRVQTAIQIKITSKNGKNLLVDGETYSFSSNKPMQKPSSKNSKILW